MSHFFVVNSKGYGTRVCKKWAQYDMTLHANQIWKCKHEADIQQCVEQGVDMSNLTSYKCPQSQSLPMSTIGAIIGGVAALVICLIAFLVYHRRRKTRQARREVSSSLAESAS